MNEIFIWIPIFLISVVVHELCHGLVAYGLGDPTAKQAGRLTLNPLKHLDPFWTILLPGLLFFSTHGQFAIGMAKPVPVNFSRLRNPRRDMIWVAIAGPLANIFLAEVSNLFFGMTGHIIFLYAIYFNLGLAMFNLIPIPPLDGSRILTGVLPLAAARWMAKIEPFGFLIIMAFYFSGVLFYFVVPGMIFFCRLLGIPQPQMSF